MLRSDPLHGPLSGHAYSDRYCVSAVALKDSAPSFPYYQHIFAISDARHAVAIVSSFQGFTWILLSHHGHKNPGKAQKTLGCEAYFLKCSTVVSQSYRSDESKGSNPICFSTEKS
uniref:DOMON domain-containing protein n=1 Tax=Steinernema glaseri TaxID=37863 RepID=A0A1I7Y2W0_9BILA